MLKKQSFLALNDGPHFKFTEAVSFMINCDTQTEIDHYWEKLSESGAKVEWVKDQFGLSWQVVPTVVFEMLTDKDAEK